MLGFGDWGVAGAYLACLAATALCVVSAFRHWGDKDEMRTSPPQGRGSEAEAEEEI